MYDLMEAGNLMLNLKKFHVRFALGNVFIKILSKFSSFFLIGKGPVFCLINGQR